MLPEIGVYKKKIQVLVQDYSVSKRLKDIGHGNITIYESHSFLLNVNGV